MVDSKMFEAVFIAYISLYPERKTPPLSYTFGIPNFLASYS